MEKITELKAMAYDLIAQLEFTKARLAEVNAEIARLMQEQAKAEQPKES